MSLSIMFQDEIWPSLPLQDWRSTYETLHLWTQIVGKTPLKLCAPVNHFWESTLHLTSRGLTTGLIPYGSRAFEVEFDFIHHLLAVRTDTGDERAMSLMPKTVADFHREYHSLLQSLDIRTHISVKPQEIPDAIPFDQDRKHGSYDPEYAQRHWRILLQADRLMKRFRGEFIGKCSPVQFFWGSFDLACTRFSGRPAPERPGADRVTREAYSHEVFSVGFWPGNAVVPGPAFYAYAAPEPAGFSKTFLRPAEAFYHPQAHEFILMYDDVRNAEDPDQRVLDFFQSSYEAAATLGRWDRQALERPESFDASPTQVA